MDKRTIAMGTAPIGPLLLKMSLPGMASMLAMSLYNIVDTMWVSGLPNGTEAIRADGRDAAADGCRSAGDGHRFRSDVAGLAALW